MEAENAPDEESVSLVGKYLREIRKITVSGEYLFRGHSDEDWTLESSAERRIAHSIAYSVNPNAPLAKVNVPLESIIASQISLLEEARKLGLGRKDGRDLSDLDLLTELQHFDAATVLLDFTENPLVALYFACRKMNKEERETDKNGKVFCLPRSGIGKAVDTLKIDKILRDGKTLEWKPIMHGSAERRIISQSSAFVLNLGSHEKEIASVSISHDDKDELIKELSDSYGISTKSLYIDLSGFASSSSSDVLYDDAIACFYRANEELSANDPKAALILLDKAILLQPEFFEALNNRGNVKFGLGDLPGAISDYARAIELQPDHANAFVGRGNVKSALGDLSGAISDYDRAIELQPNNAAAFNNRGNVKSDLGDLPGAISDYDRAIELQPDYADAFSNRGTVKSALGDLPGAISDYDRAIELQPDHAAALNGRGSVKGHLGQLEDALADLNRSIELEANIYNLHSRGVLFIRRGEAALAETDFQAMKTKLPNEPKHEKKKFIDELKQDLEREKDNQPVVDFNNRCIEVAKATLEK